MKAFMVILFIILVSNIAWADWPGVEENLPICIENNGQYLPQIVTDEKDGCIIIWYDARDGDMDVYGQRVNASGDILWDSSGIQFTNVENYSWVSTLAACADGEGGAFFAWQDSRNGNWDVFVQHVDSTGTEYWPDNGINVCATAGNDYVGGIVPDGHGGCIVAWDRGFSGVRAQRFNAAGNKSWDTLGIVVSSGTNSARFSKIVSDDHNGVIACWLDGRHPGGYDIYAQRIDSLGNLCWADTCIAITTLGNIASYHRIRLVSNNNGRYFVTWDADAIRAQCVSFYGDIIWQPNGVVVGTGESPRITTDDSDGAVSVWRNNNQIYAQRLNANGQGVWQSGVSVGVPGLHEICKASNGYFIVTFDNIKAQAFDTLGEAKWNPGGESVSTVTSGKLRIQLLADTCGGLIAVWGDERNGNDAWDIYAQRIDPGLDLEETVSALSTLSLRCAPNPFCDAIEIRFHTAYSESQVSIMVYDITGQLVAKTNGGIWNGRGLDCRPLQVGVYFLKAQGYRPAKVIKLK